MQKIKERTCRICGAKMPKGELLRYVLDGGDLCPDEDQTKHGRGVYVCSNEKCRMDKQFEKKLIRSLQKDKSNRKTG